MKLKHLNKYGTIKVLNFREISQKEYSKTKQTNKIFLTTLSYRKKIREMKKYFFWESRCQTCIFYRVRVQNNTPHKAWKHWRKEVCTNIGPRRLIALGHVEGANAELFCRGNPQPVLRHELKSADTTMRGLEPQEFQLLGHSGRTYKFVWNEESIKCII